MAGISTSKTLASSASGSKVKAPPVARPSSQAPSVKIRNGHLKDSTEYFLGGADRMRLVAREHKRDRSAAPKHLGRSANLANDRIKNRSALETKNPLAKFK